MNTQHKAIRALLTSMAPTRAVSYIRAFELPEDEEICLVECDVKRLSAVQVAMRMGMTPDTVKKKRQRAFAHIADAINHSSPATL